MAIERILGTDTGKAAFEKSDRNFVEHEEQITNLNAKTNYSRSFHELYADFNNVNIQVGTYSIYSSSMLHPPFAGTLSGLIDVKRTYNGEIFLEFRPWNSIEIYLLHYDGANGWSSWQKILTDKQPDWIIATLQNGWTGSFLYRKNNIGQLEVKFNLTAGTITSFTVVTALPSGYQPADFFDIAFMSPETAQKAYFYYNAGSSTIYVSPNTAITAGQKCAGSFVVPI